MRGERKQGREGRERGGQPRKQLRKVYKNRLPRREGGSMRILGEEREGGSIERVPVSILPEKRREAPQGGRHERGNGPDCEPGAQNALDTRQDIM